MINKKCIWLITSSMLFEDPLSESDKLLWGALQETSFNTKLINPLEIGVDVTDEGIRLYKDGIRIALPDLVIVRKKRGAEEHTYTLAQALEKEGVAFFEPVTAGGVGKAVTTIKRTGTIPVIPTLFASKENLSFDLIEELFEYPMIVKPQKGFRGKGVSLVSDRSELENSIKDPSEEMMIQKHIEILNEYRVMVVRGESIGIAKKNSDAVAKNAAIGGSFEKADNVEVINLAINATSLQSGVVYGVDIAETKEGKLYVIECNRAPEFAEFNLALGIKAENLIIDAATKDF